MPSRELPPTLCAKAQPLTEICESDLPLDAAVAALEAGVSVALAVITRVEGASYRPVGAAMVCAANGAHWGNVSSGCIERDVAHHAAAALADGQVRDVIYGLGSPYKDLVLPCGGGLEMRILPRPDLAVLRRAQAALRARQKHRLVLGGLVLDLRPQLRFLVFGKGPEARSFADLAYSAGYVVEGFTPDASASATSVALQGLVQGRWPEGVAVDPYTAIALFFHDHEWEPALLAQALSSPAFYIGAQGSRRAAEARDTALRELGVPEAALARLARPFGLIASVRDPRSLAISVLAQVIEAARSRAS